MDLNLLEDFVCLSDVRNFSRAAEMRNISQSTLSKHIRSLEHWVGMPLIDRSSYPVRLTAEGQILIRQARDLVQQFHNLRNGLRSVSSQPRNQINILAQHTLRLTFLPRWRHSIEALIGAIEETPVPALASYGDTVRMFRNDESDLLVTYVHPSVRLKLEMDELDQLTVGTDRVLPISAPDSDGRPIHDLDRGDVVRYLSYGTESFFAQVLAPLLRSRTVAVNVVASNPMSVALLSLVRVGSGMAWVPESLCGEDLAAGRVVLAGQHGWIIDTEIAIYRKKANTRAIVQKVWQAAQANQAKTAPPPAAGRPRAVTPDAQPMP